MAYTIWTDTEKTQLQTLVGRGIPAKQIADVLGKDVKSVYNQKVRLGLTVKQENHAWTEAETRLLERLVDAERTLQDIATVLGRPLHAVKRKKHRLGLTKPNRNGYQKWTAWELRKLRRYCERGYSLDRICTYFPSRNRKNVQSRIAKMTRYWLSPAEQADRKRLREKHMRWRVY